MSYVALITGASSGIGAATARRLAQEPDVRLVLVARRAERLEALVGEIGGDRARAIPADLTNQAARDQIAATVEREHGALNLLVNNAGARWSAEFADGGWENVALHMRTNFGASVQLTEALLPLLRRSAAAAASGGQRATGAGDRFAGRPLKAPVAIVNVSSTSGRISRRGTGGYAASKAALSGWSDSLALEEGARGVHVGLVLPGFVRTEGFPQAELRARALTRWLVCEPAVVVEAILDAGPGGRAEVYAPGYYRAFAALRALAPGVVRRALDRETFTTETHSY